MWRLVPVLLVGCYTPHVPEGAPCGPGGACPASLQCSEVTNTCLKDPVAIDAPEQMMIDALVVDAGVDTPLDSSCSGAMTFDYTGTIVTFAVPSCATTIRIEAWGAEGGDGTNTFVGGKGAHVAGTFVAPPAMLKILVGGEGIAASDTDGQRGGTGGGGTFIADTANTPLLVAGGGGGAVEGYAEDNGGPGQITTAGQIGGLASPGGTDGNGGTTHPNGGYHSGTGGGGFLTDGTADSNGGSANGTPNGRGKAFVNGGAGGTAGSEGRAGGFGGGGAAGFTGGGGGGYSGGASSDNELDGDHAGGGGGSYNAGTNQVMEAGINTGNGKVIITW